MSGNLASLRRTIEGAKDLRSVVRTMKAVSASSVGQYEESVRALADYYRSVELGLGACLRAETEDASVGDRWRPSGTRVALVFGSDQGLVGQFNTRVSDFAVETLAGLAGTTQIWAVGERVHEHAAASTFPVSALFELPVSIRGITPLVGDILTARGDQENGDQDPELYLFYNRPESSEVYSPVGQRLLPLDQRWIMDLRTQTWPSGRYSQIIGEDTQTLRALIKEYLFISIFRACAESLASENASRLAAMERADQNIDDMLKGLNGTFHRLRKEGIDEELFDVIAAFDTLQGGG